MRGIQPKSASTSANLADAINYARCEFRDGRSEREVFDLLIRNGQPNTIRGLVHELYLESLGVCTRDQIERSLSLSLGVLAIVSAGLLITHAWWIAFVLAGCIGLYTLAVDRIFSHHWRHRQRKS